MPHASPAERKAYKRSWDIANRDKLRALNTKWNNSDIGRIRRREWQIKNKEKALASREKYRRSKRGIVTTMLCNARKQRRACDISAADIFRIWPLDDRCPVLGVPFGFAPRHPYRPSLDRFDSSLGYTKDNISVISWRANKLKNDATLSELRALVDWMDAEE